MKPVLLTSEEKKQIYTNKKISYDYDTLSKNVLTHLSPLDPDFDFDQLEHSSGKDVVLVDIYIFKCICILFYEGFSELLPSVSPIILFH